MKTIRVKQKLSLNKKTISKLNQTELFALNGGKPVDTKFNCGSMTSTGNENCI